jgi:molybdenum cofactor cytidylyltransferase
LVDAGTINFLLQRFWASDKSICAPVSGGKRGLPVCFGKKHYPALRRITGDIGARYIIRNNREDVLLVYVEKTGLFVDVDVEPDVEWLLKNLKKT